MKKIVRNEKGFTLVELMIVVAIIGILAAIAIPQFAAYRIKGYNASAISDIRNLVTSEAAFSSDWSNYGRTGVATQAFNDTATILTGPSIAGTTFIAQWVGAANRQLDISLSNNVTIYAECSAANEVTTSFLGIAKHLNGNMTYGVDSDTSILFQNSTIVAANTALTAASAPGVSVANDFATATAVKAGWLGK